MEEIISEYKNFLKEKVFISQRKSTTKFFYKKQGNEYIIKKNDKENYRVKIDSSIIKCRISEIKEIAKHLYGNSRKLLFVIFLFEKYKLSGICHAKDFYKIESKDLIFKIPSMKLVPNNFIFELSIKRPKIKRSDLFKAFGNIKDEKIMQKIKKDIYNFKCAYNPIDDKFYKRSKNYLMEVEANKIDPNLSKILKFEYYLCMKTTPYFNTKIILCENEKTIILTKEKMFEHKMKLYPYNETYENSKYLLHDDCLFDKETGELLENDKNNAMKTFIFSKGINIINQKVFCISKLNKNMKIKINNNIRYNSLICYKNYYLTKLNGKTLLINSYIPYINASKDKFECLLKEHKKILREEQLCG